MKTAPELTSRDNSSFLAEKAGKDESYTACSKLTELKSENESLQKENLKLQSIIQDVTAVNKRWQKYNNERRLYVQKLLSTIQDLQEQINLISEKSAFQSKPEEEVCSQQEEIGRLKKEHEEHIAVLELQIKSNKDDWDAERKEKRKALQEKEDLQVKVQELTREVKFLKEVLQEERQRNNKVCAVCQNNFEQNTAYSRLDFRPAVVPLKVSNSSKTNFRSAIHVPYDTTEISNSECFYTKADVLEDNCQEQDLYFTVPRNEVSDTFSNERFPRIPTNKKSGDTIVVEDENGIRLSITEQFPSKDLKSILKKNDKKNKPVLKSFPQTTEEFITSRNRIPCTNKPNITCEEYASADGIPSAYTLSVGFQDGGLAQVTSFSPDAVASNSSTHYLTPVTGGLLNVEPQESRSKSEPNTRSNSSENLRPLRESSSWNNESFGVDFNSRDSTICPGCDRLFPPSTNLKFMDHFEFCQTESNQF